MRWNETITLIATFPPENLTDDDGFATAPTESETEVFGNRKSVSSSEFYRAAQTGIAVVMKYDIHSIDYTGQTIAAADGKRYRILRTYEIDGETTELTLSDMAERSA